MSVHRGEHRSPRLRAAMVIAATLALPGLSAAPGILETLAAEAHRNRVALDAIPASPLVDGDRPRLKLLLDDVESLLKAGRLGPALETWSAAAPGVTALARAGAGWDDTGKGSGKHLDDLAREWEEAGRSLKADRNRFPAALPRGQSALVRALAEQALGQVDEHYAVAVDYGRFSGVSAGAYYLGRAEGQLAAALFLSRLTSDSIRPVATLPGLAGPIARVENDIIDAYAKPGSTAEHTNFIVANSSLKLAKELDQHGLQLGSLVTLLRSLLYLSLATGPAPDAGQDQPLAAKAGEFERRFAASKRDDSIGESLVEKARVALEKSRAGGEGAGRERQRAAALLSVVIPRYIEIMEGSDK
ncbi:MAG TPA: hypothetical protein PKU70_11370 [Vicinamibacteria bacterium]|nr:hypothetical protein [Vicinamibacteria bacterium]